MPTPKVAMVHVVTCDVSAVGSCGGVLRTWLWIAELALRRRPVQPFVCPPSPCSLGQKSVWKGVSLRVGLVKVGSFTSFYILYF